MLTSFPKVYAIGDVAAAGNHRGVSTILADEKRALEEYNKAFWF